MNSEHFVNYFPEIAKLTRDEQIAILEQARYQTFVGMGQSGKGALILFVSLLIGLFPPILAYFIFGHGILINALAIGFGVALASVFGKKLNGLLLKKGLQQVLAGNAI